MMTLPDVLGAVGGIAGILALIVCFFHVGKWYGRITGRLKAYEERVDFLWKMLVENAVSESRRARLSEQSPLITKKGCRILEQFSAEVISIVSQNQVADRDEVAKMISLSYYDEIQKMAKQQNLSFFSVLGLLLSAWEINNRIR